VELILLLPGLLVGALISWFFYNKSSDDLRRQVDDLKNDNRELLSAVRKLGETISPSDKESMETVEQTLAQFDRYSSAEPGVYGPKSTCPQCRNSALKQIRFGPGPLGVCNAWYRCGSCGYEFQSSESASD
jgi:predicted Zn-ribbon and HTH transcriptional regulator